MVYQPITEVCAVSELCTFACQEVPLPLILLGSRHTFRPFLYFWHYDALLITETPITYKDHSGTIHLHGLVFLKLLFMLDKHPFYKECLQQIEMTGWKAAKESREPDAYADEQDLPFRDPNIVPPPVLRPEEVTQRANQHRLLLDNSRKNNWSISHFPQGQQLSVHSP